MITINEELVNRLRRYTMGCVAYKLDSDFAAAVQDAADAIEELTDNNVGKWIPVTERLPEHLTSVIVHRKDGGIFIWEYFDTSPTDECWIDDSMNVYSFYDVTHWMSLPEPPKEETC